MYSTTSQRANYQEEKRLYGVQYATDRVGAFTKQLL
jgi:hypothetical protein